VLRASFLGLCMCMHAVPVSTACTIAEPAHRGLRSTRLLNVAAYAKLTGQRVFLQTLNRTNRSTVSSILHVLGYSPSIDSDRHTVALDHVPLLSQARIMLLAGYL
jgi:hypothetical protein